MTAHDHRSHPASPGAAAGLLAHRLGQPGLPRRRVRRLRALRAAGRCVVTGPVTRPHREVVDTAAGQLLKSPDAFLVYVGVFLDDIAEQWVDVGLQERGHADRIARAWIARGLSEPHREPVGAS